MAMNHLSIPHLYKVLFFILFLLTSCQSSSQTVTLAPSPYEEALKVAREELPSYGKLEQGPDGYVYLKVPNRYVYRLFPILHEHHFDVPYAIKRHTRIGAHISVFYKGEALAVGPIREIGYVFDFEPERIKIVRSGRKQYIILEVKSPQLELLRQRYGLSPKLMDHEFHITLAEKNLYRFDTHLTPNEWHFN
jgi:hypothetical protein